jgi:hypothetical protein
MSEAEVRRTQVKTWNEVPKRYHTTLKRRLHGRMRLANSVAAAAENPEMQGAYHKLVVRKKFRTGWCYGVATFLPTEQPPYTYQVTYHDGDLETLMPQTVKRNVVRSWDRVPEDMRGILQAMGGRMTDQTGDAAPALPASPTQPPHASLYCPATPDPQFTTPAHEPRRARGSKAQAAP